MGLNEKKRLEFLSVFVCWCDSESRTESIIYCFYFIKFSSITKIPPNIPPFCQSQNFLGGVLWYFCQAVKYGRIVTPAITRRLVGWCLPYSSSRPILPFGRLLCVSALSVMRPNKKSVYIKKSGGYRGYRGYRAAKAL